MTDGQTPDQRSLYCAMHMLRATETWFLGGAAKQVYTYSAVYAMAVCRCPSVRLSTSQASIIPKYHKFYYNISRIL